MAGPKYFLLFVVLAFVALGITSEARNDFVGMLQAVDPNCFVECSGTFGDNDCLAFCINRKFNGGQCTPDQGGHPGELLCCCNP